MDILRVKNANGEWVGIPAIQGPPGKSAYELAVENGFTGTEAEWLESLGAVKNIQVSTTDLEAGVTALDTGTLYVVYE